MVSSHGYRRQTRNLFSQAFRKHGMPNTSTYLTQYAVGEYVDIKVNPAIHKGMPHKYYHGRTGIIKEVNRGSVIVLFNRILANKTVERKVIVGIEHIRKSKCQDEYLKRLEINKKIIEEAEKKGEVPVLFKRQPKGPKPAVEMLMNNIIELSYDKVESQ
ncbi:60s ribosomal protein L21 [Spraguea lophii 42_110]|uniref:60s ribosomal protein L21 n=1 Tax=Spraguea lophii (strain 42_110) TaxID=1358809 RepID=S7W8F6_SPRLO|nr:Chain LT0, 60s ribosomal protein L21 [Spraguea lophii 42_110]7QJH_KT0 Chain KT0, 60s ribosomal protein L21 [Spraguea lophii 42_110]7QJH_LT0 Chain LT0, 60s ribosomal protein L21 [Spraguea lophii 42_110]8BR3_LT0 Chain LT0, 60s ribosomal protein L21 [Spraguea lophii 42_110]8P5D_LT0 Chain LT0, 60s ribosomal protein L21 [Spraguea lophii 42_110]8P60_KT0 Chain KT0, 60s ribosomal protein L21 [Spraguea lophii 42_110]8P60_LT0 Chain LT0, 60s ribosomal protein L21 [Spraguea lophii 42_110]EPR79136.1 6